MGWEVHLDSIRDWEFRGVADCDKVGSAHVDNVDRLLRNYRMLAQAVIQTS